MPASATIIIEVEYDDRRGDIDIELLNDDGTVVARSIRVESPELIEVMLKESKLYYLKIFTTGSPDKMQASEYSLSVKYKGNPEIHSS